MSLRLAAFSACRALALRARLLDALEHDVPHPSSTPPMLHFTLLQSVLTPLHTPFTKPLLLSTTQSACQ